MAPTAPELQERTGHDRSAIIVIDALQFRRAGLASLLETWARALDLEVVSVTPEADLAAIARLHGCRMAVLSIGGVPVSDPAARRWLEDARTHLEGAPIVIISDREEADEVVAAFRSGVRGFVPTSLDPSVALRAFTFIIGGGSFFPPSALLHPHPFPERAHRSFAAGNGAVAAQEDGSGKNGGDLTHRQHEVLDRLRHGKSNKVIARELQMQESTVKVHVRQIMRKLGAANRTQAALLADMYLSQHKRGASDQSVSAGRTLPAFDDVAEMGDFSEAAELDMMDEPSEAASALPPRVARRNGVAAPAETGCDEPDGIADPSSSGPLADPLSRPLPDYLRDFRPERAIAPGRVALAVPRPDLFGRSAALR